jgi:hypothetical protein
VANNAYNVHMERGISLVVSRSDDRVVVLLPNRADDDRNHAILTEDEAFCTSSALRRMAQSRDRRTVEMGDPGTGLRIERVDHPVLPIEMHLDDDEGTTVVDMTRDDALTVADMLWGAHRSTGHFHGSTSLSGGRRRRSHRAATADILPRPDETDLDAARLIGGVNRRVRGQRPEAKN